MTEHLVGSYPTLKFRNNQARDNGQTNAHADDMSPIWLLSYGRERLSLSDAGFRRPEVDNGDKHAFSYSICSAGIHSKQTE